MGYFLSINKMAACCASAGLSVFLKLDRMASGMELKPTWEVKESGGRGVGSW